MNHQKEKLVRACYNKSNHVSTKKEKLSVGDSGASHEFDLYQKGKVIGGVSTSPWLNKSGSNNTGGQDRAAAELLWLTLWSGKEKRVHILTNKEMVEKLYNRFKGAPLRKKVEILYFNLNTKKFVLKGILG